MDRENSAVRKKTAEKNWPSLSAGQDRSRASAGRTGNRAGQKKNPSAGGGGQRKSSVEKSGNSQRKTGAKKPQSQPEVMTIRSGMRTAAYSESGQHHAQAHSGSTGGRRSTQTHSVAPGSRSHTSGRRPGEDELRRMQNRQTQNRKSSQARRHRSARRSRQMLCGGMAVICLLVLFLVSGRMRQGNPAEASGQPGMILAENKKTDAGAAVEAANMPEGGTSDEGAETSGVSAKSWANHLPDIGAMYGIYVNQVGWSHFFADNSYCMAPVNQFITAFRATVHNQPEDMTGTIAYRVNLSGSGWLDWTEDAGEGGSSEGEMPLEAVSMKLTGELGENYDILYSVLQNQQWTDWMKNGEEAGVSGAGLRLDGIRISIVKKNEGGNAYAGNIDPTKPMLALTYDDGPSAHATPRILETLEKYNSRATFFMVGKQAEKRMDVVKRMEELGCEVANHTYDHTLMTKVPPEELASQLARTNQVVSDACGISPVLMRPCGGARSEAGMNIVGAISMPAVLWSIDTLDWKTRDAQTTIQTVLDQAKDGDIILMHDLYDATADASEVLIPELVSRGFQLVTVSELASYRGGMLPGHTYSRFRPQ